MDGTLARALLGVPTHATTDLIRRAFRVAAFDAHPDQGGDDLRFRQLVAARDLLLTTTPDGVSTAAAARDRFAWSTRPAPALTIDVVDIVRRPRHNGGGPTGTRTTDTTFDEVLAQVLAA